MTGIVVAAGLTGWLVSFVMRRPTLEAGAMGWPRPASGSFERDLS